MGTKWVGQEVTTTMSHFSDKTNKWLPGVDKQGINTIFLSCFVGQSHSPTDAMPLYNKEKNMSNVILQPVLQ